MILVDYNQVMVSNLFGQLAGHTHTDFDENMLRHMFLNSLRQYRLKFKKEFGELVICADGRRSWRKDVFEYYKAARKKTRDESELDWNMIHSVMEKILDDLDQYFPYKTLKFDRVEADDIIGTLAHEFGTYLNSGEQILIMSSDKDFIQLQKFGNVRQYNPIRKEWVEHSNPTQYLKEHLAKGDRGDGIPNVLSQDNCFMVGVRQKMMTKGRLAKILDEPDTMDTATAAKLARNRILIDLECVPDIYKEMIMKRFDEPEQNTTRQHLLNYFMENRLRGLMGDIGDF